MKTATLIMILALAECTGDGGDVHNAGPDAMADGATGCGDGVISTPEVCDGTDLGGWTCPSDYPIGDAICLDGCAQLRAHCCREGGAPCFDFDVIP